MVERMNRSIVSIVVASLVILAGPTAAQRTSPSAASAIAASGATLPVSDVVLSSRGLAEIIHRGTPAGPTIAVEIPRDAMPAFVRSVQVVAGDAAVSARGATRTSGAATAAGSGGTSVLTAIRFPAATVAPIDLGGAGDAGAILAMLVGTEVQLLRHGGAPATGRILAARGRGAGGDGAAVAGSVTLMAGDRIQEIALSDVREIVITEAAAAAALGESLAAVDGAVGGAATVRVALDVTLPTPSTVVELRYLQPLPIWQTSYRIAIDGGRATFSGWAHVHNTSTTDWEEVTLTLVSGLPDTRSDDLYTPVVPGLPGPVAFADAARPRAVPMAESAFASAPTIEQGTAALAVTLPTPVTARRGESRIVPIIVQSDVAPVVRRWGGGAVRLGVAITNHAEYQLPEGVATVTMDRRYAGDTTVPLLPAGGTTVLTFAEDPAYRVIAEGVAGDSQIATARLVDGTLVVERREFRRVAYRIEAVGTAERTSIEIEHRVQPGWQVDSPTPVRTEGTRAVFDLAPPGAVVVESRLREQRVTLIDSDEALLTAIAENQLLDPATRRRVMNVIELRAVVAEAERRLAALDGERRTIVAEQTRIRENMAVLDPSSRLYARYVDDLEAQESDLAQLSAEIIAARVDVGEAETRLRDYLRSLGGS